MDFCIVYTNYNTMPSPMHREKTLGNQKMHQLLDIILLHVSYFIIKSVATSTMESFDLTS